MKTELADVRKLLVRPFHSRITVESAERWSELASAVRKLLAKLPTGEDIALLEGLRATLMEVYRTSTNLDEQQLTTIANQIEALDRLTGAPAFPAVTDELQRR